MKCFKTGTPDSCFSEETVYCIEPINLVTNNSFGGTDVILDSSSDSSDKSNLPSALPVSELNSKFIDTVSTAQTSRNYEKTNSSSENSITLTVAAQRPPLSPILAAAAITPANTPRLIHIPDPSHIDLPFPLPPPLFTKLVIRKSNSFEHRKSFDATFCDKQTTSDLQKKDEPSTSINLPDLKTVSDMRSETFSLLYPKLSSNLYFTCSVEDNLNCESIFSSIITLTRSSQPVTHCYNLRSRSKRTLSSPSTKSTSSLISAVLRQNAQLSSSASENLPSFLSDIQIGLRPSSGIDNLLVFTHIQYLII